MTSPKRLLQLFDKNKTILTVLKTKSRINVRFCAGDRGLFLYSDLGTFSK